MGIPSIPTRHQDEPAHRQRIAEVVNGVTSFQFDDSRVRTQAEITAGVTPVNYAYAPGIVDRYAAPGETDYAAAISAAIKVAIFGSGKAGIVRFLPGKEYTVGSAFGPPAAVELSRLRITGGSSKAGSATIRGTHAGSLLEYLGGEFVEIDHLNWEGAGCSAIIQEDVATGYTSTWNIHDCSFSRELTECIQGNLILCNIHNNLFGYHGTVGTQHRHINCIGNVPFGANDNIVERNRFYGGKGNRSCDFIEGAKVTIRGNNYEQNNCPSLYFAGMEQIVIDDNWFETNDVTAGTPYEILMEDSGEGTPNRIVTFSRNRILAHSNVARFFEVTSTGSVTRISAKYNRIESGLVGDSFTRYNTVSNDGLIEWSFNTGYEWTEDNVTVFTLDAFHARRSTLVSDVTGDGTVYTVICNSETKDNTARYNSSTGAHVANSRGLYQYSCAVKLTGIVAGHTIAVLTLVTTGGSYPLQFNPLQIVDADGGVTLHGSWQVPMAYEDEATISVTVSGGTKVVDIPAPVSTAYTTWFAGHRLVRG
jgi:hypothetical protein